MNFLVHAILPYLLLYKYWAIFGTTFLAALAFPIPPGTLLMASAAFAGQGYFNFSYVVIVGSLGNILGDNFGYWIARRYGKQILYKLGFKRFIDSEKYASLERRMKKNPGMIIFISRFEVFSNLSINLLAGLSAVPYLKYIIFDVVGEVLQVFIYCSIGYVVGDNWQAISALINNFFLLILLLAGLFLILFWNKIFKQKDHNPPLDTPPV